MQCTFNDQEQVTLVIKKKLMSWFNCIRRLKLCFELHICLTFFPTIFFPSFFFFFFFFVKAQSGTEQILRNTLLQTILCYSGPIMKVECIRGMLLEVYGGEKLEIL
jgi:hypothetical protein